MSSDFIPLSPKQIRLIDKIIESIENDVTIGHTNAGYINITIGNSYEPYSTIDTINWLTYIKDSGEYRLTNRELLNGIRNWWIKEFKK
jgi:hypothetical protein